MLRGDLAEAGLPYVVEGPDGPLHADFHSLRHTYLTLAGKVLDLRTVGLSTEEGGIGCARVALTPDSAGDRLSPDESQGASEGEGERSPQTPELRAVESDCDRMIAKLRGEGRTHACGFKARQSGDASAEGDGASGDGGDLLAAGLPQTADSDLARVVGAWPDLPAHIRAAVLALLASAGK